MQPFKQDDRKETMASSAARLHAHHGKHKEQTLPAHYESAVLRLERDAAVEAFDVLAQGGQYGIVGKYTYVVTPRHVALLNEARIPFDVQSAR